MAARGRNKNKKGAEKNTRIAIVDSEKCKPKKCRHECKKVCPVVRMGKMCIEITSTSKTAILSEDLCVGCGICPKKCPFGAISIINLPASLEQETSHRYGANTFKLHRLPVPRRGKVLGLVGTNGIGKSTALKILAGKLKPNLGHFAAEPDWEEILVHFRGNELQNYFTAILEDKLRAVIKPQYVDSIAKVVKGKVGPIIKRRDKTGKGKELCKILELDHVLDRDVPMLSGGELQRFAILALCIQKADCYMFDEPSSYLDVKQRLVAARVIRSLAEEDARTYVITVEHDLAVLDYLSDYIHVLYGKPGAYGVVTAPFSVREGINIFLAGFVHTENLRFRDVALTFKVSEKIETKESEIERRHSQYKYPSMRKTLSHPKKKTKFILNVQKGSFASSEIIVLLGQNGTGKTTFIRMLAGLIKPDDGSGELPQLNISYKPQKIAPRFKGSVRMLLKRRIKDRFLHPSFMTDVTRPLKLEVLLDQPVLTLSGGELQRVAMVLALGASADIYLIDEPSAYLDSEQRLVCAKVIKRFILHAKKTGFVVEHDFIMATYLADTVIVFDGRPGVETTARAPQSLLTGMNSFLKQLEITFRRDPTNFRPRINKANSVKDREQKASGNYFFMDDDDDDDDTPPPSSNNKKSNKKPARKSNKK